MQITICEICKETKPLETHHIQSICLGGTNDSCNKCKLCGNCHNYVHLGELIIEGRFQTTNGNVVIYRKKDEESVTGVEDPKVWIIPKK